MYEFEGLLTGRVLSARYRIEEVIGRGGMGAVYRATDERLERDVAVKVILPAPGSDTAMREQLRVRFHREARAAAKLHHPNVVTIHDFGTDPELRLDFLVMQILRGYDLAKHLTAGAPCSVDASLRILKEASQGVGAGHRAGLVHRDVKPSNIFLVDAGQGEVEVRMLDFGIAHVVLGDTDATTTRFTQFGNAPLSPAYAAPEQLRREGSTTAACDVFSLGTVGYELLCGRRPYSAPELERLAAGEVVRPRPAAEVNPSLDPAVAEILDRSLAFDPRDRFPDACELCRALSGACDPVRVPAAAIPLMLPPRADEPTRADVSAGRSAALVAAAPTNLAPCAGCGGKISQRALACPRCGEPAAGQTVRVRSVRSGFLLGALSGTAATIAALGLAAATGFVALPLAGGEAPPTAAAEQRDTVPPGPTAEQTEQLTAAIQELLSAPKPAPRWDVVGHQADDRCGGFFDRCVQVRCTVANVGDAGGKVTTTAFVVREDGERLTRSEAVFVPPGSEKTLPLNFPEVEAGEGYESGCEAEPVLVDAGARAGSAG